MADTHKTPGNNPGGGFQQSRRNFPYNPYAMAAVGLAAVGGLWYFYNKRKPEGGHHNVAPRVQAGVSDAVEDVRHRK